MSGFWVGRRPFVPTLGRRLIQDPQWRWLRTVRAPFLRGPLPVIDFPPAWFVDFKR